MATVSLILGLVLIAVVLTLVVYAGDGNNVDGDPSDNNACYDGRCVDDWYWNVGWYRQAVIEGRITVDQVPDAYNGGVQDLEPASTPEL